MYWFNEECTFYVPIYALVVIVRVHFFYIEKEKKKSEIMVRVCLTLCYKFRVKC